MLKGKIAEGSVAMRDGIDGDANGSKKLIKKHGKCCYVDRSCLL